MNIFNNCIPDVTQAQPNIAKYLLIVSAVLCLIPLIGCLAPRAIGFAPAIIGVLAYLFYRPVFGHWPIISKSYAICAVIMVALAGLSILWAIDPDFAIERVIKIGLVFLGGCLLFSLAQSFSSRGAEIAGKILPSVFFLCAAYAIFELYSAGVIYNILHPDKTLEGGNLSHLNRMVVIVTLLSLLVLQQFQNLKKYTWAAITAVIMIAILYKTHSQSAQVGFVAGLFFCFIFPYAVKYAWPVLGGLIAGIMLAAPWIAQAMFETLPSLLENYEWFTTGASAPARMEIWNFVSQKILEQPFFGHGIEATRAIQDFQSAKIYHASAQVLHPHNFVLQIWIEFGALGVVIVTGILLYILHKISRTPIEQAKIYLPVFCAVLVMAGLSYGLWQGWWLGLMTLLAAYTALYARSMPAEGHQK